MTCSLKSGPLIIGVLSNCEGEDFDEEEPIYGRADYWGVEAA